MKTRFIVALLLSVNLWGAEVLDRIAVVVGKNVITESEVLREIRLTAFLEGETLDFTPAAKRKAAERLVEQELIRGEMQASRYPEPERNEAKEMLSQIQRRFRTAEQYQVGIDQYGLTQEDLDNHLRWQLAALRFTEIRFQPALMAQSAREKPPSQFVGEGESQTSNNGVDQLLDAWLKDARSRLEIEFRDEVFR